MNYTKLGISFGSGPIEAHFAHANGFHPKVYSSFISQLNFDSVNSILFSPFNPEISYKSLKDWSQFADELILHLDRLDTKPIIGIGHSMGAVSTLIASVKRPDLFSKIFLIDPVVIDKKNLRAKAMMPKWLRRKVIPIAKIAGKRRFQFDSKQDAYQALKSKRAYRNIPDKVFKEFIEYAFVTSTNQPDKVILSYSRDWEQQVYITVPNTWTYLSKTRVPTVVIRGAESDLLGNKVIWDSLKDENPNINFSTVQNAGHLVPLEQSSALASTINNAILNTTI